MKRLLLLLLIPATISATAQINPDRIVHNDPAKYKVLSSVHAGAGQMGFTELIGRNVLATNFLYLHAGVINAKGGIGHHFHHSIEEMYVLLNGEAEFTVNGRTSRLKAPLIVPCKMGDAHAIYNPTGEPIRWLNFAVSRTKAQGDAFDLGDSRVGATIDKIPVFVSSQLKKETLKDNKGVLYRRALGPEVFSTPWHHVDHVVIPAGKSFTPQLQGVEEVYYVIKGSGALFVSKEPVKEGWTTNPPLSGQPKVVADDSFSVALGETMILSNSGTDDLEVLVIGISASPGKDMNQFKPIAKPKAMALQMDFVVPKENGEAFEKMYYSIYVPAMTVQKGYLSSKLLRLFSEEIAKSIQAEPTTYNYQIQISFDTEENRKRWVASEQHKIAWPAASGLAKEFKWRGYDVMGDDEQ